MFATFNATSPLSNWISRAPSLFYVHLDLVYRGSLHSERQRLALTSLSKLHRALQTSSSVRHLEISRSIHCDFPWSSFFELPSLFSLTFQSSPDSSFCSFLSKRSALLHHLTSSPFRCPEDQCYGDFTYTYYIRGHGWGRSKEKEDFSLVSVTCRHSESQYHSDKAESVSSSITSQEWLRTLCELANNTPSLTQLEIGDRPENTTLLLNHPSIQKFSTHGKFSDFPHSSSLTDLFLYLPSTENEEFYRQLPLLPKLATFSTLGMETEASAKLAAVLGKTRLSSLSLDADEPVDIALFSALPQISQTLTKLDLSIGSWEASQVSALASVLPRLENLSSLSLTSSSLSPEILSVLSSPLLLGLTFSFELSVPNLRLLSSALPKMQRLLWLTVDFLGEEDFAEDPDCISTWSLFFRSVPSNVTNLSLQFDDYLGNDFGESLNLVPRSLSFLEIDKRCYYPDQFSDLSKLQ
jgi:hypothetical protein